MARAWLCDWLELRCHGNWQELSCHEWVRFTVCYTLLDPLFLQYQVRLPLWHRGWWGDFPGKVCLGLSVLKVYERRQRGKHSSEGLPVSSCQGHVVPSAKDIQVFTMAHKPLTLENPSLGSLSSLAFVSNLEAFLTHTSLQWVIRSLFYFSQTHRPGKTLEFIIVELENSIIL